MQLNRAAAGPYALSVWTRPSPPEAGSGRLDVAVMRESGVPVTDAGPGTLTVPVDVEPPSRSWWLLAALGLLLLATPAWPHASLVRSSPARRATLTTAPDRVQLWFNEAIEPKFSSASVWDAAGQRVDREDARVEPEDPKRLIVGLKPLGRGTYRVRFRVLSVDGHVVESEFPFTLRP